MKKTVFIMLCLITGITFAYCQNITGTVIDKKTKAGVPGVTIKVKGKPTAAITDANGKFSIAAAHNDVIVVSAVGFTEQSYAVSSNKDLAIVLDSSGSTSGGDSFSPQSYWAGATIGYNVNQKSSSSTNNIIGGATLVINPVTSKILNSKWSFAIVGNVGNFVSSQSGSTTNGNLNTNLTKLSQSVAGLSLGISAVYSLTNPLDTNYALRLFGITRYQLNSFQQASPDTTTVSLSQWKNTLGLEFEGVQFKNGGKLHFGLAASIDFFDKNTFQQIFMKEKSSMLSLDASVILPLSTQFGFLLEGTYSQYTTPVYLIGIIIRTSQGK